MRFNASHDQSITLKFQDLSHWESFHADCVYHTAYILREDQQKLLDKKKPKKMKQKTKPKPQREAVLSITPERRQQERLGVCDACRMIIHF